MPNLERGLEPESGSSILDFGLTERVKVHVWIRTDAEASFNVDEENAEPGKERLQT